MALRADTGQAVATLAKDPSGHELLFSKDGARLFLLRFPTYPYEAERHNLTIWQHDAYTASLLRQVYSVSVAPLHRAYSGGPAFSARISLSPDERYLYLIRQHPDGDDHWEDWVDTIEVESGQLLKTISLGRVKADGNWLSHKLSTDGSPLYISQTLIVRGYPEGYRFTTVDPTEGKVIKRLTGDGADSPLGCYSQWWLSPNAHYLYCLQRETSQLRVTNMEQGELVGSISLPPRPGGGTGSTTRINSDVSQVPVFLDDEAFLQSPDSRYLYYIRPLKSPNILRVDLGEKKIVAAADLPVAATSKAPLWRQAVSWIGSRFVATAEAKVSLSISAAISSDGRHLYFTSLKGEASKQKVSGNQQGITLPVKIDDIWVLNTENLAVEKHIPVKQQLWGGMHLSSDGNRVYVHDWFEGSVTAINVATGEVTAVKGDYITGFPQRVIWIKKVVAIP